MRRVCTWCDLSSYTLNGQESDGLRASPTTAGIGDCRGGVSLPSPHTFRPKRLVSSDRPTTMSSASRQCLNESAIAVVQVGGINPCQEGGELPGTPVTGLVLCYVIPWLLRAARCDVLGLFPASRFIVPCSESLEVIG